MRQSAFAYYDNRTTHEVWCDAMVAKASEPKRLRTVRPAAKSPIRKNNYSNADLKKLFTEVLTTY